MKLSTRLPRSTLPKPTYDYVKGKKIIIRKNFKISTQKKEWNKCVGREESDFKTTSKCRHCGRRLVWKEGSYEFDHFDNNPSNNSQKNCYLACKICHGKATKMGKRRRKSFGITRGHDTIKKKAGYKKPKKVTKKTAKKTKKKKSKKKNVRFCFLK